MNKANRKLLYRSNFILLATGLLIGLLLSNIFLWYPLEKLLNGIRSQGTSDEDEAANDSRDELKTAESTDKKLFHEVRVLCWIMTHPSNHYEKAIHVKNTWGRRCNKLLFMSSEADDELGSIALRTGEGRHNLWAKTKEAFNYVYQHHMDDADWFLKADDDTYVIVENLRFLLYPYAPQTPIYFGCKFRKIVEQGYMSGGAGYVLSKEALRRFIEDALPNPDLCREEDNGAEDAEIGKCLANVNVTAGDSRDHRSRGRFFPFNSDSHLFETQKSWYDDYAYYKTGQGLNCCSDSAISFHYIPPNLMYAYDYLIYELHPYGVKHIEEPLPPRLKVGATLPSPTEENIEADTQTVN